MGQHYNAAIVKAQHHAEAWHESLFEVHLGNQPDDQLYL